MRQVLKKTPSDLLVQKKEKTQKKNKKKNMLQGLLNEASPHYLH